MSNKYPGGIISLGGPESYSNSFNGSSSYLGLPSSSALSLSGDFTIEFWVYANSSSSNSQTIWCPSAIDRAIQVNSTSSSWIYWDGSAERSFGTFTAGVWSYITLTRSGTTVKGFLNGLQGFSINDSGTLEFSSGAIGYRQRTSAGAYFNGNLSNFRITKGAALYTENFVPPTGIASNSVPSGTVSLLTCQSSTIVDNSSNAFTITNTGGVTVSSSTPLQAYNPNTLNPALGAATNGVWTLPQALAAEVNRSWPMYDPYYNQVVLNLHGNGTNAAQNNTFLDSSSNNFTITRNGNTTQGSFSPYGQGWSAYFPSEAVTYFSPQTYFEFATGNNTIECWFYPTVANVSYNILIANPYGVSDSTKWGISATSSATLQLYKAQSGPAFTSTNTFNWNQWNHLVLVTDISAGNTNATITFYINGVGNIQTGCDLSSYTYCGQNICFNDRGGDPYSTTYDNYISNFRWVRSANVYSGSSITVPTAPLTAITNTKILTLQSNRFVDNSGNNLTIYPDGISQTSKYQPFLFNTAYTPETIGGSGYFDGSGDYLTVATNSAFAPGTGDFTIEGWVYPLAFQITGIFQQGTSYFPGSTSNSLAVGFGTSGNHWQIYAKNTNTDSAISYTINNWQHFALVRSGTTTTLYVNGASAITLTSDSTDYTGTYFALGSIYGTGNWMNAYVSDIRMVKGTAVYTGAFTPPTLAPLATSGASSAASYPSTTNVNTSFASSACSLLLSATNAGVFDNAVMNNLETVGTAQISTAQKKYGTGSIKLDGSGYLSIPPKAPLNLYGQLFTIEMWVYPTVDGGVMISRRSAVAARGFWLAYGNVSSGKFSFRAGDSNTSSWEVILDSANTFATNQWHHVAVTAAATGGSSGLFTLWVNGTSQASQTAVVGIADDTSILYIGGIDGSAVNTGYIDDLRWTEGYARYTVNFTPPTSQLQDQ